MIKWKDKRLTVHEITFSTRFYLFLMNNSLCVRMLRQLTVTFTC